MNLRFFIQDNEPCSLRNIKKMYEVHCMEDELKKKLNRIITNINQELEIKWAFKINCVELTYREIFDGYIYGRIAHNNRERHSKLLLAIENKMAEHLALVHFIRVLVFTFNMIERIYTINEELIKKL